MKELELLLPEVKTSGSLDALKFPEVGDYNFWKMYNDRILLIEEEIEQWDAHIIKDILNINKDDKDIPVEDRKPIIILINSWGGLVDVTLSICQTIKLSKTPVWTVNMGQALSAAALIFLMGEKRFTTRNSWVMCHAGSGGITGSYNESKEAAKVWDAQVKAMGDIIVTQTGMDEKLYKRNKNKDWWFSFEQQLEYNFATEELTDIDILWR